MHHHQRFHHLVVLLLPVLILATGAALPFRAAAARAAELPGCSRTVVAGVAHEDDDLLFLNPDLAHDMATRGTCVRIIYLTGGVTKGGGTLEYLEQREDGAMAGNASFAKRPGASWDIGQLEVNGHTVKTATLPHWGDDPNVQLVFLRLPDSNILGEQASLYQLWSGKVGELTAFDDSTTYTRADLLATLQELLTWFMPDTVRVQDYMTTLIGNYDRDHAEHISAARFMRDAATRYDVMTDRDTPTQLIAYRDYGITDVPPNAVNLTPSEQDQKMAALLDYGKHDAKVCKAPCTQKSDLVNYDQYVPWTQRQYQRPEPKQTTIGNLVSWMGGNTDMTFPPVPNKGDPKTPTTRCLTLDGAYQVNQRVQPCTADPLAQWIGGMWDGGGYFLKNEVSSLCLDSVQEYATTNPCQHVDFGEKFEFISPRPYSSQVMIKIWGYNYCLVQGDLLSGRTNMYFEYGCDRGSAEQRWIG